MKRVAVIVIQNCLQCPDISYRKREQYTHNQGRKCKLTKRKLGNVHSASEQSIPEWCPRLIEYTLRIDSKIIPIEK